jgi:hypothetical protein
VTIHAIARHNEPMEDDARIRVEITDPHEFHCFRLLLNPQTETPPIEIMFHARSLVDLIHKCSLALCDWQAQTSAELLARLKLEHARAALALMDAEFNEDDRQARDEEEAEAEHEMNERNSKT